MEQQDPPIVLAMWKRHMRYGSGHEFVVQVMRHDTKYDYPTGITSSYDDKMHYQDLQMRLYISDMASDLYVHMTGPEYVDVYSISGGDAVKMTAFFKAFERNMTKDQSSERGDIFATFARTVGAKEVCIPRGQGSDIAKSHALEGNSWSDTRWVWYSVAQGKNIFRSMADELTEMEKIRRGLKVAA